MFIVFFQLPFKVFFDFCYKDSFWATWDPFKKKDRKIPVLTVLELAHQTFWRPHSWRFKVHNTKFSRQKHCQNMSIYWRETLNKSNLEQNSEICGHVLVTFLVPFLVTFLVTFLLQIGTCSGFVAIFLTANALCSPVRKENPASRACGKKYWSVGRLVCRSSAGRSSVGRPVPVVCRLRL